MTCGPGGARWLLADGAQRTEGRRSRLAVSGTVTSMRPADTSDDAWQVWLSLLRDMTPAQRVDRAVELCRLVDELAAAGVRSRHPDYDDGQVRMALHRLRLGDDLTRAAWPDLPLVDP